MNDLAGRRIMLVEDDILVGLDHADRLKRAGAEIIGPFALVKDAIKHVESGDKLDAAVIDFVLADTNSEELQDTLDNHDVPFVIVTAYPRVLVRRDRSHAVLSKPATTEELCDTVSQFFEPKTEPPAQGAINS